MRTTIRDSALASLTSITHSSLGTWPQGASQPHPTPGLVLSSKLLLLVYELTGHPPQKTSKGVVPATERQKGTASFTVSK